MSFSTLSIGASALTAAQRAVEVASHNVANSTVEGYTRQRVQLAVAQPGAGTDGVRGSGMRGNGVQVVSIERLRSSISDLAVRSESSAAGSSEARAAVLDRAQGILGPYGDGLPQSLTKMWNAFSALATDPAGPATRGATLDTARQVAVGFNDAAADLAQIRTDTATQIGEEVKEVNSLTRSVAGLNRSIADALAGGQAPNDLLDIRDLALDRLAFLTGSTARQRDDGMVDVSIGGVAVVTGTVSADLVAGSRPKAGYAGEDPTVSIGGAEVTAGGLIGGQVKVATTDLRAVEDQLSSVADTVMSTVNAQHALGFDLAGQPGKALFVRDADGQMAVTLTPDEVAASGRATGGPLDGEGATAMSKLRQADANGVSLGSRLVGLATTLGSRAADAARTADATDANLSGLREQRSAADGVSIDEEMIDLVKFQHAYSAASRVISIADGMLDTIINRMGAGR